MKAAESYLNDARHTTRPHRPYQPIVQNSCAQFLWIKLCATIECDFQTTSVKAVEHFEYFLYSQLNICKTICCACSTEPAVNANRQECTQDGDFSGCAQATCHKNAIFPGNNAIGGKAELD
jgi:hypothetical protein